MIDITVSKISFSLLLKTNLYITKLCQREENNYFYYLKISKVFIINMLFQ